MYRDINVDVFPNGLSIDWLVAKYTSYRSPCGLFDVILLGRDSCTKVRRSILLKKPGNSCDVSWYLTKDLTSHLLPNLDIMMSQWHPNRITSKSQRRVYIPWILPKVTSGMNELHNWTPAHLGLHATVLWYFYNNFAYDSYSIVY